MFFFFFFKQVSSFWLVLYWLDYYIIAVAVWFSPLSLFLSLSKLKRIWRNAILETGEIWIFDFRLYNQPRAAPVSIDIFYWLYLHIGLYRL
jgi:hypothetical protein